MPVTVGEWFACFWDLHRANMLSKAPSDPLRPLECVASPGDILFVPHGW
jgi:hypothetical protein